MLSQKITKETLLYKLARTNKEAVLSTVHVFNETLIALKDGGTAPLNLSMTVITNSAYYLKTVSSSLSEKDQKQVEFIERSARKSNKIITDLLGLARDRTAEKSRVQLSGLIEQTLGELPLPENMKVINKVSPDLPHVVVDEQQIGQIFENLVSNAFQAMPEGGTLTISVEAGTSEIRVSFADTGCGISEENIANLFESLYTTKAIGIGLGLTVCKNLIELNGGRIEVTSKEGEGSTFNVILPTGDQVKA